MFEIAPECQWTFNAPLGVYQNPKLSQRIVETAMERSELLQFVQLIQSLGTKRGETITLPVSTVEVEKIEPLRECERIPDVDVVETSLTVHEWGRALPYTGSLSQNFGSFDPENCFQARLIETARLIFNACVAGALRGTPNKAVLTVSKDGTPTIRHISDGDLTEPRFTAAIVAKVLGRFNRRPIRAKRDGIDPRELAALVVELNAKAERPVQDFILVAKTKALRALRRDKDFVAWTVNPDFERRYTREVGQFGPVRIVECNVMPGYNGTGAEAFLFHGEPVGGVFAQELELRAAIPSDFGRHKAIALYGIAGFGLIWPKNVIHICGATAPLTLRDRATKVRAAVRGAVRRRKARTIYATLTWLSDRVGYLGDTIERRRNRYDEERFS